MIAVKYRAKNLFIANIVATSYEAELPQSALSASCRKLFNEMLWQAHNARPDETSGDGDVGRELRSQWAAAWFEFLAIAELLNLITELSRTRARERERENAIYIHVRLTFAPSLAPATIEFAVRIVEYVRRERPRLNRETTTRRNNNEISFCSSGEPCSGQGGTQAIWKLVRISAKARRANSAPLSGQRRGTMLQNVDEWYISPTA